MINLNQVKMKGIKLGVNKIKNKYFRGVPNSELKKAILCGSLTRPWPSGIQHQLSGSLGIIKMPLSPIRQRRTADSFTLFTLCSIFY
jgi:hypothetical protein